MDNPYSSPQSSEHRERPRLTLLQWTVRAIAGLFLGWLWATLVGAGWTGLAALAYGDVSRAFDLMHREAWAPYVYSASLISMLGSWVGGLVGPLSMGVASSRVRRPILVSSACGTAFAAAIGVVVGLAWMWFWLRFATPSVAMAWMMRGFFLLSVVVGLVGGWLGGRVILRDRPVMDDAPGDDG